MLSNTKEILKKADKHQYAVAAFSVYNWETVKAAIKAAEKVDFPVILALAERYLEYIDADVLAEMVKIKAEKSHVPIGLHLDHAYKMESIQTAIKAGFSSVMYDGSQLALEENVRTTREIVDYAHSYNVAVEAELGSIAKGEHSDEDEGEDILTDPLMAKQFVEETNIDFLAPAIGTVHGMYKKEPVIDLNRLAAIQQLTGIPLVLHGGSGTPEEKIIACIQGGIRKINVNTEVSIAAISFLESSLAVFKQTKTVPHLSFLNENMQKTMIDVMEKYIRLFANSAEKVR